jgi:capsular polysaccharide biosynthesis protein
MELRRYYLLIRQRLLLVVVAVIVGAGIGYAITSRVPFYTATAEIYVGSTNLGPSNQLLYQEADLNEIVATYSIMIPQPVIAQKAINQTHANRFAGEVSANTSTQVLTGTQLIDVSVTDRVPATAVSLANGVTQAFVSQIKSYTNNPTGNGAVPSLPAHVFQPAIVGVASSSGLTKRMLLGGIFGLVISIFMILLLDYLDITIKSPDELERRVGLPVLGIIPRFNSLKLDASPGGSVQRPLGATRG